MEEDVLARREFDAKINESRKESSSWTRWKDQIEEAVSSIDVANVGALEAEAPGKMEIL